MSDKRPSPKKFLAQAKEEEKINENGKLKIYLGSAPGVGKTYAMLADALRHKSDGFDVAIGVIATHGRPETEELSRQFETISPIDIEYHDKQLSEFNLEAALKRRPELLLVDEMAHTNAPGAKHSKRWQDIRELLDEGINVATTLNVQHIESLNDSASQIIHTIIKETVPDFMIELADSIELVDLPPEELLKRLEEGKVYFPEQIKLAQEHFFRRGNLVALRELALRATAKQVNADVRNYRNARDIQHIWATQEKWLVCVGSRLSSARLIRTTRRITQGLQAEWLAVHIKKPNDYPLPEEQSNAAHNLRLARELGAKMRIITTDHPASEIIRLARRENITTIVVGKSRRSIWLRYFAPSLSDQLVKNSGEIDVHIIAGTNMPEKSKSQHFFPWGKIIIAIVILLIIIIFTLSI